MDATPTLITRMEAAVLVNRCLMTIDRRIANGVLTVYRIPGGNTVRLDKEEVERAFSYHPNLRSYERSVPAS